MKRSRFRRLTQAQIKKRREQLQAWRRRSRRLRSVNLTRRVENRRRAFGVQADLCRCTPCCACGAPPPSVPHHEPPIGLGGANPEDANTVPLCAGLQGCHLGIRHGINGGRRELEERFGVDLDEVKREMRRRVRELAGEK